MEALTAVTVSALTVYDMCKVAIKMIMGEIALRSSVRGPKKGDLQTSRTGGFKQH